MGRPRKVVLLVEPDETQGSVLRVVLQARGYAVDVVPDAPAALAVLRAAEMRAVDGLVCLLELPVIDGNELALLAKRLQPETPVLLYSRADTNFERANHADGFLPRGMLTTYELLTRLRILTQRKRGPKKRTGTGAPVDVERAA